jgi:hypothetical protein
MKEDCKGGRALLVVQGLTWTSPKEFVLSTMVHYVSILDSLVYGTSKGLYLVYMYILDIPFRNTPSTWFNSLRTYNIELLPMASMAKIN